MRRGIPLMLRQLMSHVMTTTTLAGHSLHVLTAKTLASRLSFGTHLVHIRGNAAVKGRSFGGQVLGSTGNLRVAMMAAYFGLDPAKAIHWVTDPSLKPIELFVQGKIDAFLGFPPEPQDLRARHIGNVIVNS